MIPLLFPKTTYAKRRAEVLANLETDQDLVIFFTSPTKIRSADNEFKFRPDSSFYYLSGFAESSSAFLLWKERDGKKEKAQYSTFVLPKDLAKEQWTGYRYGVDGAKNLLGADFSSEYAKLETAILDWLAKKPRFGLAPRIFTNASHHLEHKIFLDSILQKYRPIYRAGMRAIESVHDISRLVEQQRLIKDSDEIKVMQKSADINVRAHLRAMHEIKSGMMEYEIQAIVEHEYTRSGCYNVAYDCICASGANATILHYHQNDKKMKSGELFLIDAGCEYSFYASDITRTIPVNGKYSKQQRIIMDIVMEAHDAAMSKARVGETFKAMHDAAEEALIEGLIRIKLVKGTRAEVLKSGAHLKYYPHRTGHWLGIDVHDECPYNSETEKSLGLKPGMVFTVEPGLYFMENDTSVPAEWRGIGVRIEDDVVITARSPLVLTSNLPRSAKDIEQEMSRRGKN